jgi:hypothetical protein
MATIDASVDIQFHPNGDGYVYPNGNSTLEKEKLKVLLRVCGQVGQIFKELQPKRTWWKKGGLKLNLANGQVLVSEVVDKVNAALDDNVVSNKALRLARGKLDKAGIDNITPYLDTSHYPPMPASGAPDDETAMAFGVKAPGTGGRVYYGPPDGPVTCCVLLNVIDTATGQPVMLSDSTVADGRIDIILGVHFAIPSP